MNFLVVIDKTPRNFSAYVPDLPGCVATGNTHEEVIHEMRNAIALHIESLREHEEQMPVPSCTALVVEVSDPN